MKRVLTLLMVIATLLCVCSAVASAKAASETTILFLEAEDCKLEGFTVADKDGAVGKAITSKTTKDKFTLTFTLPKAGTFRIWFKVNNMGQGDNSLFYNTDGKERIFDWYEHQTVSAVPAEERIYGRWLWVGTNDRLGTALGDGYTPLAVQRGNIVFHSPVYLELKEGENSIVFTAREAGGFIDQIIVTDDLDYDPADVSGNTAKVCEACNLKHFVYDPADFGKSPKEVFDARLAAEKTAVTTAATTAAPATTAVPAATTAVATATQAPAATTAATAATTKAPTTAAQTADPAGIAVLAVVLSGIIGTAAVIGKRK